MKPMGPLVSICMPAYNAADYIAEAVGSVLAQSYRHWELIIVNDGSTDDTASVLQHITDERVQVHHQNNKGQCAAANQAFGYASGALIKFMDADDLLSVNYLEQQVLRLENRSDAVAFAAWGRFYQDDLRTFRQVTSFRETDEPPLEWLINSMSDGEVMLQCALWLIPRPVIERSGLWDETLNLINDFEFFIRVLLCANILLFAEDAVLYYRSGNTASLSSLKSRKGAESAYNAIDKGTGYLLRQEASPRVKKIAANYFQNFIYSFYPFHQDLIRQAQQKVDTMGGSDYPFQAGGHTKLLVRIVGWKLTKWIKLLLTGKT